MQLTVGQDPRQKKVLVVSHERSGTHFLMNTIALNFDYMVMPWFNLDLELGVNFHADVTWKRLFGSMQGKAVQNIGKAHFAAPFIQPTLPLIQEEWQVFYIYREPAATMRSFYSLLHKLPWDEGPKSESVSDFIRTEPSGGLLRFQKQQEENMLKRWESHVRGWTLDLPESLQSKMTYINYDDLNNNFACVVERIGEALNLTAASVERPEKGSTNKTFVVEGKKLDDREPKNCYTESDLAFIEESVGKTVQQLEEFYNKQASQVIKNS